MSMHAAEVLRLSEYVNNIDCNVVRVASNRYNCLVDSQLTFPTILPISALVILSGGDRMVMTSLAAERRTS